MEPEERPTFSEIVEEMDKFLSTRQLRQAAQECQNDSDYVQIANRTYYNTT